MISRGVIPYGMFEGAPCLEVYDLGSEFVALSPEDFANQCLRAMAPGVDFIHLHNTFPWGSEDAQAALVEVLSRPVMNDLRLWRAPVLDDDSWAHLRVHTVLDCSDLIYANYTQADLESRLYSVSTYPDEILLVNPPPVSQVLLDDLLGRLGADMGYIYVQPEQVPRFAEIVSHACTRWHVRRV